jgi:hypothetical protein
MGSSQSKEQNFDALGEEGETSHFPPPRGPPPSSSDATPPTMTMGHNYSHPPPMSTPGPPHGDGQNPFSRSGAGLRNSMESFNNNFGIAPDITHMSGAPRNDGPGVQYDEVGLMASQSVQARRGVINSKSFYDVVLYCGPEKTKVYAYQGLLAACSPYFEELFTLAAEHVKKKASASASRDSKSPFKRYSSSANNQTDRDRSASQGSHSVAHVLGTATQSTSSRLSIIPSPSKWAKRTLSRFGSSSNANGDARTNKMASSSNNPKHLKFTLRTVQASEMVRVLEFAYTGAIFQADGAMDTPLFGNVAAASPTDAAAFVSIFQHAKQWQMGELEEQLLERIRPPPRSLSQPVSPMSNTSGASFGMGGGAPNIPNVLGAKSDAGERNGGSGWMMFSGNSMHGTDTSTPVPFHKSRHGAGHYGGMGAADGFAAGVNQQDHSFVLPWENFHYALFEKATQQNITELLHALFMRTTHSANLFNSSDVACFAVLSPSALQALLACESVFPGKQREMAKFRVVAQWFSWHFARLDRRFSSKNIAGLLSCIDLTALPMFVLEHIVWTTGAYEDAALLKACFQNAHLCKVRTYIHCLPTQVQAMS